MITKKDRRRIRYLKYLLLLLMIGCTDSERSTKILKSTGFTNIKLGGYGFFDCSDDDVVSTKFIAQNSNGDLVSGTVCCGLFKNCTIRFE